MHTTNLRKVGGSIMLAVPPAILDLLHLRAGNQVGLSVDDGRLVIEPQQRPRYNLTDLLAQCSSTEAPSAEDRTWTSSKPVGDELI